MEHLLHEILHVLKRLEDKMSTPPPANPNQAILDQASASLNQAGTALQQAASVLPGLLSGSGDGSAPLDTTGLVAAVGNIITEANAITAIVSPGSTPPPANPVPSAPTGG